MQQPATSKPQTKRADPLSHTKEGYLPMTPLEQFIRDNLDDPYLEEKLLTSSYGQVHPRRKGLPKSQPPCGTITRYINWGCRCPLCVFARAEYGQRQRGQRHDSN